MLKDVQCQDGATLMILLLFAKKNAQYNALKTNIPAQWAWMKEVAVTLMYAQKMVSTNIRLNISYQIYFFFVNDFLLVCMKLLFLLQANVQLMKISDQMTIALM